ncbi:MAG: BON domain-containing protein [Thermoguttaceae bacterium]|jgi:osmotically-inducible protein OsmY
MSEDYQGRLLLASQSQERGLSEEKQVVQAEAQLRLRKSGYPELRLIACAFHEGVLTLRGRVTSFYLKQMAQTLIRELEGVGEINNRLVVAAPPCPPRDDS